MTHHISIQQLRQVSDTLAQLRGCEVLDTVMRSDFRQIKIVLADATVVLIAVAADDAGQPRLEVDVVQAARADGPQLEVRFDSA